MPEISEVENVLGQVCGDSCIGHDGNTNIYHVDKILQKEEKRQITIIKIIKLRPNITR